MGRVLNSEALDQSDAILSGVRRGLEREWGPGWSRQNFGPGGATFLHVNSKTSVIVTTAPHQGQEWLHASIAHPDRDPTYSELVVLYKAVFGDRWAYQVFAPKDAHVNIHKHALHLWSRLDGEPVLPNFGQYGTI